MTQAKYPDVTYREVEACIDQIGLNAFRRLGLGQGKVVFESNHRLRVASMTSVDPIPEQSISHCLKVFGNGIPVDVHRFISENLGDRVEAKTPRCPVHVQILEEESKLKDVYPEISGDVLTLPQIRNLLMKHALSKTCWHLFPTLDNRDRNVVVAVQWRGGSNGSWFIVLKGISGDEVLEIGTITYSRVPGPDEASKIRTRVVAEAMTEAHQ